MPKVKKKTTTSKLFASSALRAIAVVVLTIGVGALILPQIFANSSATINDSVSNLSASPTGGGDYAVRMQWSGNANYRYVAKAYYGPETKQTQKIERNHTFSGLKCGVSWKFEVYAVNKNGAATTRVLRTEAKPVCPAVAFDRVDVSGTTVTAYWRTTNFASSYTLYFTVDGKRYGYDVSGTRYTIQSTCGKSYSFDVTPRHGGQTGSSAVASGPYRTAACPVAPPPQTPAPRAPVSQTPAPQAPSPNTGTSGGSSGGTSGGSSSAAPSSGPTRSTRGTPVTGSVGQPVPAGPPATPQNFAATIASSKVVELTWDAVNGADKYLVSRSTDQQNWVQIAETENNFYDDESAEFSATYYYQVQAVGSDGQISGIATTEATTEAFAASSSKLESGDKKVSIVIPEGAIDGEYSCSVSSKSNNVRPPSGFSSILGPYDVTCVTVDGDIVNEFIEPLEVTFKLGTSSEGYQDLSVRLHDGRSWSVVRDIRYDQNKQQISFKLASTKSFAVVGVKQESSAWIFFLIFFLLLVVGGIVFFVIRRRRSQDDDGYSSYATTDSSLMTTPTATIMPAAPTPEEEFRQAVAQPDCSHLDMAQQVIPSSMGCQECEQQGTKWTSLRICLICGHVGCSDDSPEQHSFKHFNQTGHPLIYEYGNPEANSIGWCYIDQTYI